MYAGGACDRVKADREIDIRADSCPVTYSLLKEGYLAAATGQISYASDNVLVETKAIAQLTGADRAQVINALRAITGLNLAILINFKNTELRIERLVRQDPKHQICENLHEFADGQ